MSQITIRWNFFNRLYKMGYLTDFSSDCYNERWKNLLSKSYFRKLKGKLEGVDRWIREKKRPLVLACCASEWSWSSWARSWSVFKWEAKHRILVGGLLLHVVNTAAIPPQFTIILSVSLSACLSPSRPFYQERIEVIIKKKIETTNMVPNVSRFCQRGTPKFG